MRTAFIKKLMELAEHNSRIMLLTGDLGFGVVTHFAERFPKQYLNVGIAEQNMVGIATGLALSGKVVFTYSIANFPILRCLEQIRNDVCYHHANVISVSIGAGLCYGSLGMTHQATEDIAILRSLPYLDVLAPGDPQEAAAATEWLSQGRGPAYLRLGRAGEPIVHSNIIDWKFGKAIEVRSGNDLTMISTGTMLKTAMDTASLLDEKGIHAQVLSMHTIKPLDKEAISTAVEKTGVLVTLEEHSRIGGFSSAIMEALVEMELNPRFKTIALPSEFCKTVGDQKYLLQHYGLDPLSIENSILKFLAK